MVSPQKRRAGLALKKRLKEIPNSQRQYVPNSEFDEYQLPAEIMDSWRDSSDSDVEEYEIPGQ